MRVRFLDLAASDLDRIDNELAKRSPAAAKRISDHIRERIYSLERFPALGHPGRGRGTRELLVKAM